MLSLHFFYYLDFLNSLYFFLLIHCTLHYTTVCEFPPPCRFHLTILTPLEVNCQTAFSTHCRAQETTIFAWGHMFLRHSCRISNQIYTVLHAKLVHYKVIHVKMSFVMWMTYCTVGTPNKRGTPVDGGVIKGFHSMLVKNIWSLKY